MSSVATIEVLTDRPMDWEQVSATAKVVAASGVARDEDAQLILSILYELHYRVSDSCAWHPDCCRSARCWRTGSGPKIQASQRFAGAPPAPWPPSRHQRNKGADVGGETGHCDLVRDRATPPRRSPLPR